MIEYWYACNVGYEQLYVFRCLCFIYIYIYMVRENPVFVREFKIDGSKKRVGSSLLINVPIADG